MNLDEYLWRNKISIAKLARTTKHSRMHISNIVHHKDMPSIYTAPSL